MVSGEGWSLPPCQSDGEQGVASTYIKKRIGEQELEEDHSFKHSVKECLLERMGARGLQMIHIKMRLNCFSEVNRLSSALDNKAEILTYLSITKFRVVINQVLSLGSPTPILFLTALRSPWPAVLCRGV